MVRILIMFLTAGVVASGCGTHEQRPGSGSPDADAFLARYVTTDGRVLRHDQGNDIVSEGQAYGMLIAEIANRPSTVRTIWSWTKAHMQRPDGLLISHLSGSAAVQDSQPAADADTLAAYALLRYSGEDKNVLHDAGRRLAAAVLGAESTMLSGAPLPLAGPWAKAMSPPVVNPSYWMPAVFAALGRFTGNDGWRAAAASATNLLAQLTDNGQLLPTDWAQLADGRLAAIPHPQGNAPIQYGLDAARLPVWLGTACTADARLLAAHWWSILSGRDRAGALALTPTGGLINRETNPLPLVAAATAARAADDEAASRALQDRAAKQSSSTPTYYGDAWLALGGALLDSTLDPCGEAGGG